MNNKAFQEILELEEKLIDPKFRNNRSTLDALLADDFFEFGCSGKQWERQETIETLLRAEPENIEISNFEGKELGNDVYLATYRTTKISDNSAANRSSIWKKDNGGWKLQFHQGTKINAN